jgi:hypothetical protein
VDNEDKRIYCHDCGAKLDKTLIPKKKPVEKEDLEAVRKRIARMANPTHKAARREVLTGLGVLGGSALVAFLLCMFRDPERLPRELGEDLPRALDSDIAMAVNSRAPIDLQYREEDINRYLGNCIRDRQPESVLTYTALYVCLEPGKSTLGTVQDLFGLTFHSTLDYRWTVRGAHIQPELTGGALGRVRLPLFAAKWLETSFSILAEPFKRERQIVSELGRIETNSGTVSVQTKPLPR